jgi:hypothetical protein
VLPEDIVDGSLDAGGGDWGPLALNVMVQAEERERQSEILLMENNERQDGRGVRGRRQVVCRAGRNGRGRGFHVVPLHAC